MSSFHCRGQRLDLTKPLIMGVLNVTPDSFSDGGRWSTQELAFSQAESMLEAGARIIDIGGESTRPGALPVDLEEELRRVIPIVTALKESHPEILLSVDTSKPEVMSAAIDAGADIINDVNALQAPKAIEAVAASSCGICLMHMQGTPETMQHQPAYSDVLDDIRRFLNERLSACIDAGIESERIILDPGFGFGKTLTHNLSLLADLRELKVLGRPILVGLSRKSMFAQIMNSQTEKRLIPSVVAAVLAVQNGASIVRVHDVAETNQGLQVWQAIAECSQL